MDISYCLLALFSLLIFFLSIGMLITKSLISSIIISSIISLVSMFIYCLLKAPDVAITEAAIGSAISSVILLITTTIVGKYNNNLEVTRHRGMDIITFNVISIITIFIFSVILSYIFFSFPKFGDPDNYLHNEISSHYITYTKIDFAIPNIVTAILGGYRGFDTLLETTVILTAAVGVFSILQNKN